MTAPIYTVYKTTNITNNKIYIGVHGTNNPNDSYLGSGNAIKSAIRKYGKSNFTKEILFEYDNPKEAYLKESQLVNKHFISQPNTYNEIIGGGSTSGYKHTNKTKTQFSIMRKGRKLSTTHKSNLSISQTGRIHKTKTLLLLSKIKLGILNPQFKGFFITPWGKFESSTTASTKLISYASIRKWCKNSNESIGKLSIAKSKYLQSLKESPIGKTFNDIGFDFELK